MYTANKDDNVANLKNSAKNFSDDASQAYGEAKQDLRETANKAGRKVRGFIHDASDEIVHAKDAVTSQIRTNPVQSSLIAAGVGFVLGALFRR
jgi:ElaB/YqjD/DUF883 family membrane-anchored ribosome-binding protein